MTRLHLILLLGLVGCSNSIEDLDKRIQPGMEELGMVRTVRLDGTIMYSLPDEIIFSSDVVINRKSWLK